MICDFAGLVQQQLNSYSCSSTVCRGEIIYEIYLVNKYE